MTTVESLEMPCRELVALVTDYIEGRLSETDRARFDAHIAECPYCATYLEQMRQVIRALGRLPEESLSPHGRDELTAAFRGWAGATPPQAGDRRPASRDLPRRPPSGQGAH